MPSDITITVANYAAVSRVVVVLCAVATMVICEKLLTPSTIWAVDVAVGIKEVVDPERRVVVVVLVGK